MTTSLFVRNLRALNRKERFYLVGAALGNVDFRLSIDFIRKLRDVISSDAIDFLDCRFVAMDYHLDWLYVALKLAADGVDLGCGAVDDKQWERDIDHLEVSATQQDIDLVAVFADEVDRRKTHLLLVEAKGVGAWNTAQLESKGRRLQVIFGDEERCEAAGISVHFVYAAPQPPASSQLEKLPALMKGTSSLPVLRLELPRNLVKVTQCTKNGTAERGGTHWKVERERASQHQFEPGGN